jgi:predicted nucleotidyltransferase
MNTPLILPVGTQVVSLVEVNGAGGDVTHPRGAVGVVVKAPVDADYAYRVKFPDGTEAALKRQELSVLAHFKREQIGQAADGSAGRAGASRLDEYGLFDHVIFRCVVGSRAYGLEGPDSDYDRRGVYLPPADLHWSLYGMPEQIDATPAGADETYWEIQKFLTLALKSNPNVLECLYTPLVEHAAPLAQEMLDMRQSFLSRMAYQTYNGYVLSQFKKLAADLRAHGEPKWKHVMHLLRLLIAGVTVLREGYVPVHAGEHRDRLLAVKRGEVVWDEIEAWRLDLHRQLDRAAESTQLPERPDYEKANGFLIRARRSAL